jgi:hypothetical protein
MQRYGEWCAVYQFLVETAIANLLLSWRLILSRVSEKWGQRSSELGLGLDEAKRLSDPAPPVSPMPVRGWRKDRFLEPRFVCA